MMGSPWSKLKETLDTSFRPCSMSTIAIIVTIVVLLAALVCGAFISQTVQNKRAQRIRILAALKSRSRKFKAILVACPVGFLTRDLHLLVLRNLVDVSEQLSRLEPKEASYIQDMQMYSGQLTTAQTQPQIKHNAHLNSMQAVNESKMCLEELYRFVAYSEEKNIMPHNQAEIYRAQIKQLVLQLSIDLNELRGHSERENDRPKVAAHYYTLALKFLSKKGRDAATEEKIIELTTLLDAMKQQVIALEGSPARTSNQAHSEQEELDRQWQDFGGDGDDWKKKSIYD